MLKTKKITVLILAAVLFTYSIYAANANTAEQNSSAITDSIFQFSFELYSRIKELPEIKAAEGNLFFSPYSISTALAMTYTGARGNTAIQMAEVLQLPSVEPEEIAAGYGALQKQLQADPETSGYQLNVANALWGQQGYNFLPEFLDINKNYFGSGLNEVDFARAEEASKIINTWIEEQTKEKIKNLITPGSIDAMTRLVLTNAIYFKGDWASKFKEENTKPADFNVTEDKTVEVQMMYQKERFGYSQIDGLQLLELPYKGDELSMLVVLPKTIASLSSLENSLNLETLKSWLNQMREREVDVYLPKFKMTCGTLKLRDILCEMGMKVVFFDSADFSGMNGNKDLHISNVMHKAFVEVNEEGTEAAAATAVGMKLTSLPKPPPVFRADRPFIFMILDTRSNNILFMGRVMNPTLDGDSEEENVTVLSPKDKGNFNLYVSNQSFANSPVDIKIYIDNKLVVNQEFDVGNQHNWKYFKLNLVEGAHKLRVESEKGETSLNEDFDFSGEVWAVLDYWFYPDTHYEPTPKHFSFHLSNKPVGFE